MGTQMIVMLQHSIYAKRCRDLTNRQISFKILRSWFWALFYAISVEKTANEVLALIALPAATGWMLCEKYSLNRTEKWYEHCPECVV